MYTPCPSCNSGRVITKNLGKQTGGLIGAAGGAASGAAGALSGAEAGAVLGVVGGPVGIAIGSIAGAILGGLFGGVAGGIAGATLGEQIDDKVLANYQCLLMKPSPTTQSHNRQHLQSPHWLRSWRLKLSCTALGLPLSNALLNPSSLPPFVQEYRHEISQAQSR